MSFADPLLWQRLLMEEWHIDPALLATDRLRRADLQSLLARAIRVKRDVVEAARPHASILARVVPALRAHLGDPADVAHAEDPAEERLRVQRAVADWLVALSTRTPLCLFVDDIQRCDEASAAAR